MNGKQGVTKPGLEHKSVWFRSSDLSIISPEAIVNPSAHFAHLPLTADVSPAWERMVCLSVGWATRLSGVGSSPAT